MNKLSQTPGAKWYDPTMLVNKVSEPEVGECPNCGCTFFEQVEVRQFPKEHNVVLGQAVQPAGDLGFYVFRCIKCREIFEPNVQVGARDYARKMYDRFLDDLEKPLEVKSPKSEVL